jgi:hypothetical protein
MQQHILLSHKVHDVKQFIYQQQKYYQLFCNHISSITFNTNFSFAEHKKAS